MIPADRQSTLSKLRRPQKNTHAERRSSWGTRRRAEFESEEGDPSWSVQPGSRRGPWESTTGIDNLPLGKRQVMEKFFTPVHSPRNDEIKVREHHHHLPHHHQRHHYHHQDKDSYGYATPGSSSGSQGHIHRQRHGHHSTEHVDYPHNRPQHQHSQHHSRRPDVSSHSHAQNLDPAASSSGSYSSTFSSSSWSSEASIDKETFLARPGPRHSLSCSNIPGDRQGFWDEEANLEEFDGRHLNRRNYQHDRMHKLHRGHSKSEEGLLHTNSSENVRPLHMEHSPLYKSASLGRSLAFSEDTEILLDSAKPKKAVSSIQLPSKGILKNKQGQNGAAVAGNVRKAKSLEVLSTRVERSAEGPKRGKGTSGKSKLDNENTEKRKEAIRQNFVQEKLQFSAFLNEITRQVISPSRLSSLGVSNALGTPNLGQISPKSPRKNQTSEGKRQEGVKPHKQQKDLSGTPDSFASSAHSHSSKYSQSSKHYHYHRHSIGGSPQQQQHQTPGSQTDASTTSPENCPPLGQGQGHRGEKQHQGGYNPLLTDGTNTSPELSPHVLRHPHSKTHHHPDPNPHHQKHHQPHPEKHHHHHAHHRQSPYSSNTYKTIHKEIHSGALGQESDSSQNRQSSEHSDRSKHTCSRGSAAPYKDIITDVDKGQSLQEQNEELRHSLLQTVVRMECMEAELQKTQVELNSVKESFMRLQENFSGTQQTNQLLEQKLKAMAQSMDVERKCLTQRISELSRELTVAQTTILSLKTINVPSLLQELLDKHFKSKEAVTEFLLPAIVSTQFKDADQSDKASDAGNDQEHVQVLKVEEYEEHLLQSEGNQHRITAFQPWKQDQSHCLRPERDQKGGGVMADESEGEKGIKAHPPSSLQMPSLQHTMLQQSSPANVHDQPIARGHGVMAQQLNSPIHVLSGSSEESLPICRQQQCLQDLNADKPGPEAMKFTGSPLNFLTPEGGARRNSDEDEIVRNWRIRHSKGKGRISRNSLENDATVVTYQSAQKMLDNFMRHLQPPEDDSEEKGGVRGWASVPKGEVLNGERKPQ